MRNHYFANPPTPIRATALTAHFNLLVKRFGILVLQTLIPFHSQPKPIDAFPESEVTVTGSTVQQCQWLFDEAEERRKQLEQKAQSTFSLMVFLVPLLSSAFVFILAKAALGYVRSITVLLISASACFILLGFISAIRAVSVKTNQTLSIDAVLHEDGTFRPYQEAFHAKGLLWCASMNSAMNDHLAQFVRGAYAMTATAVVLLLLASLPVSLAAMRQTADPTSTKIVGPVGVVLEASPKETSAPCVDVPTYESKIRELEMKIEQLSRARRRATRIRSTK